MEGSESEAIFDSLNLNPQLFINEVLNNVDHLVDTAFDYYQEQASMNLKTDGTDRSDNLTKGTVYIRNMIQGVLDKRLGMWEKYCLQHCFSVPNGFSLPTTNELPGESSIDQEALNDPEMDEELNSLRSKLTMVGRETAELNRELQALERQSVLSKQSVGSVKEALELYEQNSGHDMFQEMIKVASELRKKMEKLNRKGMEEIEHVRTERIYNPSTDWSMVNRNNGLANAEFEDLQKLVADITNM